MRPSLTIVIPVYNGASVLHKMLKSIEIQTYPINKIILVDDYSTDESVKILTKFKKTSPFRVEIIFHSKNRGLAQCYNSALKTVKTQNVVTLMQDCIISSKHGIELLIRPFLENKTIAVSCAKTINPMEVWVRYNFWQKCLMSRHAGKILSGRNNSFCCYSFAALKKIGSFNSIHYRTAGEDADILARISSIGQVIDVDTLVEHIHNCDPNFGMIEFIKKENQRAEVCGATFSNIRNLDLRNTLRLFFRPLLLFGLVIPSANLFFLFIVFLYAYYFTEKVYFYEIKNPRIVLLPFINVFLLITYSFYFFRGLATGKQTL